MYTVLDLSVREHYVRVDLFVWDYNLLDGACAGEGCLPARCLSYDCACVYVCTWVFWCES